MVDAEIIICVRPIIVGHYFLYCYAMIGSLDCADYKLRASLDPCALHGFIEFCAGQGNMTAECLKLRLFGLCLDIIYNEDHNMLTQVGLRVMIDCISETMPGAMNWWGTRCSSFVGMSRKHHRRTVANGFWGHESFAFVRAGNMMQVPLVGMLH